VCYMFLVCRDLMTGGVRQQQEEEEEDGLEEWFGSCVRARCVWGETFDRPPSPPFL